MFLDALKIHGWHRLHRTAAVSQTRPKACRISISAVRPDNGKTAAEPATTVPNGEMIAE